MSVLPASSRSRHGPRPVTSRGCEDGQRMLDRPPRSPSDGHAAGVPAPLVSVTAAPTGRSLARPTPEKIYAG